MPQETTIIEHSPTKRTFHIRLTGGREPHELNKAVSRRTAPTFTPPAKRTLDEPVECPYLGEPHSQLKCGCAKNLFFPTHHCTHPDKEWTDRKGNTRQGYALPTIAYVPPESHAPSRFYTACCQCPLNPNQEPKE